MAIELSLRLEREKITKITKINHATGKRDLLPSRTPESFHSSGKMESTLALPNRRIELISHDREGAVIRHLQIIDASHDAGQVIVRRVRWFAGLADDREHGRERFETCRNSVSKVVS